ncbi:MAG: ABC transporter substrate-binding protein [Treponema sp.]|jgi:ABC-type glycerol-3-phosphate transport system substrate-binding protein|nr:ABC transporter substrate-binding protein [Treponema sp.]
MRKDIVAFTISSLAALSILSCMEPERVTLWTDIPEFVLYSEVFNASQTKYKVETHYFELTAKKLTSTVEQPDIVVGRWLKSASTRRLFKPLDWILKDNSLDGSLFYPKLLELGVVDDEQYLLPVSFNIPAFVFARDNSALMTNHFTISLEEAKELGKAYNVINRGAYTKIGFSPNWDDDFLFISAALLNTDFREGDPLSWNADALERALEYDKAWINEANSSIQAVDDFTFKYFFEPPVKLIGQGRILFSYMNSSEIFTLDYDQQSNLDFRWLAEEEHIPLSEDTVYYGLYQQGRLGKGAETFTKWFFQTETQRLLLENNKNLQLNSILFGIASGFSAIRNVTEEVFPRFYPSLLGHMPPDAFLSPPNILPQNWLAVKKRVILPYMHEYIRTAQEGAEEAGSASVQALRPLADRITDWYRINK